MKQFAAALLLAATQAVDSHRYTLLSAIENHRIGGLATPAIQLDNDIEDALPDPSPVSDGFLSDGVLIDGRVRGRGRVLRNRHGELFEI